MDKVIEAADEHGRQSGSEYEIGDLIQLVRDLWVAMTWDQRAKFSKRSGWDEFVASWSKR
jgi:hypothetical protein